jgi:ketosteroid isomerase-like protein
VSITTTTATKAGTKDVETARRFLTALVTGDRETFATLLHDDAVLRDLNPHGVATLEGPDLRSGIDMLAQNVGDASLTQCDARPVGPRVQVTYSYTAVKDGERSRFEVHAFCDLRDGRIAGIDEVCSGRMPD